MDIAIVGAGGIGGYLGAKLTGAGHKVALLARGEQLAAIRKDGLTLDEPEGKLTVRPAIATDKAEDLGQPDLIVLAVKAHQVAAALEQIRPAVGPKTRILPFQNGVDSPDQIAAAHGAEHALIGIARIFVNITAPGVLTRYGAHTSFVIGTRDGGQAGVAELRATLAAAGVNAPECSDVRVDLWTKFVLFNAMSGMTAGGRTTFGTIWASEAMSATARRLMEEVETLARAEGVPLPADIVDKTVELARKLPADGRTSTAHDISLGRPLEIDHLCGAVARRGRVLGLDLIASATAAALLEPWKNGV